MQACLQRVYDNGDIYADEYEGWYSVAEERFITDTEYDSGQFRDVKRLKEKNYFFKMSKYQQPLIKHIEDNPLFIQPAHRRNEILGFYVNRWVICVFHDRSHGWIGVLKSPLTVTM